MNHYEIEKMFLDDVRNKKKIGQNIFHRTATRKGGKSQALKTPYYFMSKKEKRSLHGQERSISMNEIITLEEFKKFDTSTQKLVMQGWREKFSVDEIVDGMKTSRVTFYKLIKDLGLEVRPLRRTKDKKQKQNPDEPVFEINGFYRLTYSEFKSLSKAHKIEVAKIMFSNYSIVDVAKNWGVSPKIVSNIKQRYYKNIDDESKTLIQQEQNTVVLSENDITPIKTETSNAIAELVEDFFFTYNKRGDRRAIINKLKFLIEMLEEEPEQSQFDVSITVRGR
jgi:hypothetical protein